MYLSGINIKRTGTRFLIVLVMVVWPSVASAENPQPAGETEILSGPTDIFLPVVASNSYASSSGSDWLDYLNYYRGLAGLAPVTGNPEWDQGGWLHSRYMVKNDYIGHSEDHKNTWYTPEGEAAAKSSNLVVSYSEKASDQDAIDAWMEGPFHNIGLIDPQLREVGFGSFREQDGGLQMGAALDVLRGLGDLPASVDYPIFWPDDGVSVPLTSFYSEYPDPLSSCNGYSAPAGFPIILQIGSGAQIPNVSWHSFKQGQMDLDHCVFDETSYTNPNSSAQSLGRAILNTRDAIVLMPREPLIPGKTYSVSITVNGKNYAWTFTVYSQNKGSSILAGDQIPGGLFILR